MNILGKGGLETRKNLEYFRDLSVNPLNLGLIFLFSGSMFVNVIMEKRVNRLS